MRIATFTDSRHVAELPQGHRVGGGEGDGECFSIEIDVMFLNWNKGSTYFVNWNRCHVSQLEYMSFNQKGDGEEQHGN